MPGYNDFEGSQKRCATGRRKKREEPQVNKTALLVVDVQVGVMRNAWDASQIIKNIVIAVEKARSQGIPVIWVQHSDNELVHSSPELVFAA